MNDSIIAKIQAEAYQGVLDYGLLLECLKNYQNPRQKISSLLKNNTLIRVKKGLYILGPLYSKKEVSKELLANMTYGPSYISLVWALSYYGLIPEQVFEVTSVTIKRSKEFYTPLGRFSYKQINSKIYPIGLTSFNSQALIATKEKALIDQLILKRGKTTSIKQIESILFEDLRIEEEDIVEFDLKIIESAYSIYSHSAIKFLLYLLQKMKP